MNKKAALIYGNFMYGNAASACASTLFMYGIILAESVFIFIITIQYINDCSSSSKKNRWNYTSSAMNATCMLQRKERIILKEWRQIEQKRQPTEEERKKNIIHKRTWTCTDNQISHVCTLFSSDMERHTGKKKRRKVNNARCLHTHTLIQLKWKCVTGLWKATTCET